jgi:amylosucrase
LLYYGDEIGTLNDSSYLEDENKAGDNRWMHRPRIDWQAAALRKQRGSVQQRIFDGLQKMIAVRKTTGAFADYNNRELLDTQNPHLFAFLRSNPFRLHDDVLVVGNFDDAPQSFSLADLPGRGQFGHGRLQDLYSGVSPEQSEGRLMVPPHGFYWLSEQG